MPDLDLTPVDRIVSEIGLHPDAVIPILQAIQEEYRFLPAEALEKVCELTEITPASIAGVSTFYTHFRHRPVGRHMVSVCQGTACHVKGAGLVEDAFKHHLKLGAGVDTDASGEFTVQQVACLGCCTLGPVVQIDEGTFGYVSPQGVPRVLREFDQAERASGQAIHRPMANGNPNGVTEVRVGLGSCCLAQGSAKVHDALRETLDEIGAKGLVKQVGCTGICHRTPLVELVMGDGTTHVYSKVDPPTAREIILRHFRPRGLLRPVREAVSRWLDRFQSDEAGDVIARHATDMRETSVASFLGPQKHLAMELCDVIDPLDFEEYRRHDGFTALNKCLTGLDPEQIIEQVRVSGLRGRGGAGFPTHIKWSAVRAALGDGAPDTVKYVICNGDEGDPGAFMDRMLLESVPFRIIEGMAIAARAVGAHEAVFYIRHEYPLAVKRIRDAIRQCEERRILGKSVMGTGYALRMEVKEGAGAFICGEETALIHSIEGGRGTPRLRPPYPAESGLWEKPTLINNVETFAVIPWILRNGGSAFAEMGTATSKGTKVFALAGKIVRGGLIEVPMGVSIRRIVEDVGGGVAPGRRFKAVQIGGPSGGCVPAELADTPIDYESLAKVGAIMGSGGLVVLDDADCMVDIARYFLRFTQDQSCGKCTYCRVGTKRMLDILDRLCAGKGRKGDLEALEQLSRMVGAGSLCGLGKTAPNPVLSTLKYFRAEYEEHLKGRCPAGKCVDLIDYRINDKCIGCTICAQHCPVHAIPMTAYQRHWIDLDICTRCDTCKQVCPEDAVHVTSGPA
ncbi:MAG: 4Fe-4S dicluster domain-containing protein [Planctomycetes bacterium]|nr:4Fe-4S dicluster domain-containing protein [Planctomycetota bacterium]